MNMSFIRQMIVGLRIDENDFRLSRPIMPSIASACRQHVRVSTDRVGGVSTIELSQLIDQNREPRESHCSSNRLVSRERLHGPAAQLWLICIRFGVVRCEFEAIRLALACSVIVNIKRCYDLAGILGIHDSISNGLCESASLPMRLLDVVLARCSACCILCILPSHQRVT